MKPGFKKYSVKNAYAFATKNSIAKRIRKVSYQYINRIIKGTAQNVTGRVQ